MLVTTRNVHPRAPDQAPALRNGQTLWLFPLQKAQWASNASNDTDLCYPDTASVEKRIEKVSNDAMSADRLLRPRSLRPPVRPKFLWEQIRLSMQACNSQPSSKAKKSETELLGRLFSVKVHRQQPKVQWKLVTIPFALPPFVLEPMHSPMSRDGFHEMLAADWPATSKEIAIHGRTGKSKPDPSRLKAGKLKPVPSRSSFFRKKFISSGWPWHGPLLWSFP